ncbi:MAG: CBS domain-containing protein, partial [Actinobacteria bacterium]|nr:CBS domain-containing protein [Actinomycetota bacterium]NIT98867.1 CBS domain-containing protein [Actinomycetota bacterium]NIU22494.1 CBS domain-containing protein [Actinomycetota bacterium]NIU71185.1 CBS domain-containing protein [Actinomycetota bacterium]NIV59062.1 CBS domain-containing protein [Actinomycetota bacterium]
TSLMAVIDLIVRHGLDRVPVVGEAHELLGVITAGDVLEELLPRWRSSGEKPTAPAGAVAREVMQ